MSFSLERIPPGDPIESTEVHQQLLLLRKGRPVSTRISDPERGAFLYALSINENRDRPPGEYLLFVEGLPVKIRAYEDGQLVPAKGRVALFEIVQLEVPTELKVNRPAIEGLVKEALAARGMADVIPTVDVQVDFDLGS